jgi:hypothetical protein
MRSMLLKVIPDSQGFSLFLFPILHEVNKLLLHTLLLP